MQYIMEMEHKRKRGIQRHQTPLRYRNAASGSRLKVQPYGPLRPNMTSSIKPEVHNVLQRRQRRIEPLPQGLHRDVVKIGPAVPEICSRTDRHTQTERQTDRKTRSPTGAE